MAGEPILESLTEHLREKQLLLLLDNFEHLLEEAGVVSHLLSVCPHLKILVSSRSVLHLAAEHDYPVPTPMRLPELTALFRYDAVQLFVQRAQAVKPGFKLTDEYAAAIAEICYRLDGLPLAIELAAARIRLFPPRALLGRLENRLGLLTGGAKDLPSRQQTLRNTLDWSCSLLSPEEQTLLARLSVFAGGWTFEAAEAVCNPEGEFDLLEGMASLVDRSLLRQEGEEESRFRMLETIREYAVEKLLERGEREAVRAAHARYFLQLAEEAEPELRGPKQGEWLARLDRELGNLRSALGWLLEQGQIDEELRLASALWVLYLRRGRWSEGQRWLEEGLKRGGGAGWSARGWALDALAILASLKGDYERATRLLEEALSLFRELGDPEGSAQVLTNLGSAAQGAGEYARAAEASEESLRLYRELGNDRGVALALLRLGNAAVAQGDLDVARVRYEEALAIYRAQGDTAFIGTVLNNLGDVARWQGQLEEARVTFEEALRLEREIGNKDVIATVLENLGIVAIEEAQYEIAGERFRESLVMGRELGFRPLILTVLGDMASLAAVTGMLERATRIRGAEVALREIMHVPVPPVEQRLREQELEGARQALSEDGFRAAWEEGQAMTLEQAVAYALGDETSS